MASAQLEKPCEQSSHQIEHSTYHRKIIRRDKNNSTNTHEHSLSEKVKDMAHSARKLFDHHGPDHTHNPTTNCSGVEMKKKKKKQIVNNTQGQHEGHCMPKMLDHMKNLKKKKKKKSKEDRCRGVSSSDSESSSDNGLTKKKK